VCSDHQPADALGDLARQVVRVQIGQQIIGHAMVAPAHR
jgi:hypothetical protein